MSYAPDLPRATLRWTGTTAEIALCGELDLAFADRLAGKLTMAFGTCPETLVVDLTAVSFLDSTCVGLIIDTHRRAVATGTRLVLIRPSGPARRALDLCAVDQVITCVDEAATAQTTEAAA
jgi:anti-sigma B factor antagonist